MRRPESVCEHGRKPTADPMGVLVKLWQSGDANACDKLRLRGPTAAFDQVTSQETAARLVRDRGGRKNI